MTRRAGEPPRALARLLELALGAEEAEVLLGDLREERERGRALGSGRSWYWRQGAAVLVCELGARLRRRRRHGGAVLERAGRAVRELRQTLRSLRREPGFTVAVTATAALAVGSVTAVYSVVHAVLLAPLPYEDSDALVRLREIDASQGGRRDFVSPPNYFDWIEATSLESAAAWWTPFVTLTGEGEPERVLATLASHELFGVLRARPALGRTYGPEQDRPGGPPAVVLSHGFWQRRFGADPGVLGRTLNLDGRPCEVVGVMPAGFAFPAPGVELWTSLQLRRSEEPTMGTPYRGMRILEVVARLSEGSSDEDARSELDAIARRLERAYPDTNAGWGIEVAGLLEDSAGSARSGLLALLAASCLVLMIACANVSSLVLARAQRRARELAVRAALGASRSRLLRQLLVESALLAGIGGLAGTWLGLTLIRALLAARPIDLPRIEEVGRDPRVLLIGVAATVASGILFGLVPALRATGGELAARLRFGASGAWSSRRDARARRALVVGEVALAVALLIGSGLLIRSVAALLDVDPGFSATDVAVVGSLDLPRALFEDPARTASLQQQLLEAIEGYPGVEAAGLSLGIPLARDADFFVAQSPFELPGVARPDAGRRPSAPLHVVSPGFFETLRVPLVLGRSFEPRDARGRRPVAIVNEAFVRRHLAGVEPIGQTLVHELVLTAGEEAEREIVGVVGDVRHFALNAEAPPQIYLPSLQTPWPRMQVVVRGSGGAAGLGAAVRRAMAGAFPDVPVPPAMSLAEVAAQAVALPRFRAELLALFGALALALAAVGLAGVQASAVAARVREIGVRVALGARGTQVVGMVVREGLALTLAGVALGLLGAYASSRLLAGLLFGVGPGDPLTWLVAPGLLLAVSIAACWIPARRAALVDPLEAIRAD